MTDVPRRIPPTAERRLLTLADRTAGGSLRGATAWGKRTSNHRPQGQVSSPFTRGSGYAGGLSRLSLGCRIDAADFAGLGMTSGSAGETQLPGWTFTEDEGGGNLTSASGGNVFFNAEAIYSVHMWLRPFGIGAATSLCTVGLVASWADPFATSFSCTTRGGDPDGGSDDVFASTSRTYYDPGRGDSGGVGFSLTWNAFDTSLTELLVEVHVQQITN